MSQSEFHAPARTKNAISPLFAENWHGVRISTMLVAACGYGKGVITTKIIDGARLKEKYVLFLVRGRDRVNLTMRMA